MNVASSDNRQSEELRKVASQLASKVTRPWTIMEMSSELTEHYLGCRFPELLPESVKIVHGPSCATCVTPVAQIDKACAIARDPKVILCAPNELLRIPGSSGDLLDAKAAGADVRVAYTPLDCWNICQSNPDRKVVYFSVGFEPAIQMVAMCIWQAKRYGIENFSVLSWYGSVAPFCSTVLAKADNSVNGFLSSGIICSVTGTKDYEAISKRHKVPIVITGLEPLDLMHSIRRCVLLLEAEKGTVDNQYDRAVTRSGNQEAQALIHEVFELCDKEWRGVGLVSRGGYRFNNEYRHYDAETRFDFGELVTRESSHNGACISSEIMTGRAKPFDCPLFGRSCNPNNPVGATMVSSEGTCAAYFKHNNNGKDEGKRIS